MTQQACAHHMTQQSHDPAHDSNHRTLRLDKAKCPHESIMPLENLRTDQVPEACEIMHRPLVYKAKQCTDH